MKKVTRNTAKVEMPVTRMTRAQAKASGTLGEGLHPSKPSFKQLHKRKANSQRVASDDSRTTIAAAVQHKRRAVLKDVTNANQNSGHPNKTRTTKQSTRSSVVKRNNEGCIQQDAETKPDEDLSRITLAESQETVPPGNLRQNESKQKSSSITVGECSVADPKLLIEISGKAAVLHDVPRRGQGGVITEIEKSSARGIVDIDSNTKDPQLCSFFVNDMYNNFRITELDQRPSTNYMEKVQQDITPIMRGILIDWLVEVSEEYKFVPDTLYLAVNLIDRFLSQNSIEKQRLQLLGVACMFIASKYEEICALSAEVFCFLTDNTCPKEEILKMERQVLNLLHFKLSVPTTKTFLRRFVHAAQASYQVPCVELEFLANYLSELTLVDHNFLKYLPSLIAASAIFLARWILNQSDHPWNRTLEHYTNYMASELKTTVLALDNLQQNTSGRFLNAIREKYKQQKFKCVATLIASKPVQALF